MIKKMTAEELDDFLGRIWARAWADAVACSHADPDAYAKGKMESVKASYLARHFRPRAA